ncbi:unnamed protein product [Miscanthus lutarioriparius]|uniref:Condensin complex subunit 1 C-terminal domain-containing protein n=1 Tax=Miscanthus lutarioriparius TaxID=422564 RepID=A0A811N7E9_9POAL|nr:unnamed protein product [Miscanthus lutarioriparius]
MGRRRLSDEDKGKLINTNSRVFAALQGLVTSFSIPEKIWYGAADKAISTIYTLHPAPDFFLLPRLQKKSLSSVFSVLGTEDVSNGDETENDASLSSVSPSKLGRFLFVISHIALNHLVYIENSVRKIQKQIRKNEKSQSTTEDLQSDVSKSSEAQGINAELGLGATIDIAIESLAERAEKEIVCCSSEKNLIGLCGPFLSKLCRNLTLLQKVPRPTSFCNACSLQANDHRCRVLVKGYINEMTVRIEDEDERISSLAKLFFHELSKTGSNPIYNLLPDILGRLQSTPQRRNLLQYYAVLN